PTAGVYLRVAAVLVILTVLEVGVFYVPAFRPVLVPVLLVLSAAKFALVVMFYMHLKTDSRVFTFLFGAPLLLAAVVMVALLFLGVSLNGPLHNLSDGYLFSAHMVQHLVLTLVFPPLLLYGTPAWVVQPLLRPHWVRRLARWATRPLAAGTLFSVPITLW